MFVHETEIRVRYGETDQMGYLHHGNYALYYEEARIEALRSLGMTYKDLEMKHGIMMPVVYMRSRFVRPAYYDDLIRIETSVKKKPKRNITFHFELFDKRNQFINKGEVSLAFVRMEQGDRIPIPEILEEKIAPYFE